MRKRKKKDDKSKKESVVCYIFFSSEKLGFQKRVLIHFYNCEKFQRRILNEDTNPTCVPTFIKKRKRIKVRQTDILTKAEKNCRKKEKEDL